LCHARVQEQTALLPDHALPAQGGGPPGTSLAGVVGALLTLGLAVLVASVVSRLGRRSGG
jgi:hypothetical protein